MISGFYNFVLVIFTTLIFTGGFSMPQLRNQDSSKVEAVSITVVYDNYPFLKGLQTDWGFSCLVEVGKTKLLFDTGGNGDILLSNMEKLGIDPESIDFIFLSHYHQDHTGGLSVFLEKNPAVTIYYPRSFPAVLTDRMRNSGAELVPVSSFQELKANIFSLGEFDGGIPEQSLAIRTSKGIVVITGCAHPGIVNILERVKSSFPDEVIYLAMGGFHLFRQTKDEIKSTINKISTMGILEVAPSHCSGDMARKMFRDIYNKNYIEIGTGKVIKIN
jgi:7,8-dihydropterin-6-yl-methyl-4-(beta-D-ribofuranosyl)aminobenzene 5'-phosphate synthase